MSAPTVRISAAAHVNLKELAEQTGHTTMAARGSVKVQRAAP